MCGGHFMLAGPLQAPARIYLLSPCRVGLSRVKKKEGGRGEGSCLHAGVSSFFFRLNSFFRARSGPVIYNAVLRTAASRAINNEFLCH